MNELHPISSFILLLVVSATIGCNSKKVETFELPVDGKLVYVEGIRGDGWITANPFGELVMLNSRDQTRHVLTWDGFYYAHPNLTPDGKSLIFESKRAGNIGIAGLSADSDIYRMDLKTKDITNLNHEISSYVGESIGHRISNPSLSPTGSKLAMVRLVDWQFHLSYYDFENKQIVDLTTDENLKPMNDIRWSPDDEKLIYSIRRGFSSNIILIDISNDDYKITAIESYSEDGEPYGCSAGSWLDNYRFIYSCTRPNSRYIKIFEYNLSDSSKNYSTILRTDFDFLLPSLIINKNGDNILFLGSRPGTNVANIYMLNPVTGEMEQITFSDTDKRWLRWYENL
ncbi:MAG TPA: hypothetical protein VJ951_04110 [Bacteroidales bacterium]|nr:hypothetical protein [Bacteroidales bacterium]